MSHEYSTHPRTLMNHDSSRNLFFGFYFQRIILLLWNLIVFYLWKRKVSNINKIFKLSLFIFVGLVFMQRKIFIVRWLTSGNVELEYVLLKFMNRMKATFMKCANFICEMWEWKVLNAIYWQQIWRAKKKTNFKVRIWVEIYLQMYRQLVQMRK